MWTFRVVLASLLILLIAVPLALRPRDAAPDKADRLVILTPHVQQILQEYERAFADWLVARGHPAVDIDWRQPGGTSDILRLLLTRYQALINQGKFTIENGQVTLADGAVEFDIMFGGGSYDHGQLKRGKSGKSYLTVPDPAKEGATLPLTMSAPPSPHFDDARIKEWYSGRTRIGVTDLYDRSQHWFGTALSSFGIVYNTDALESLEVDIPDSFDDLTNPRLAGRVALADPRTSGSITTSYDAILNNAVRFAAEDMMPAEMLEAIRSEGWKPLAKDPGDPASDADERSRERVRLIREVREEGWTRAWRLLREMGANARYFSASSTKPPIDVSEGEAAAGLAIDFYGRSQAQAVTPRGMDPSASRVGYVDPAGSVFVDPDPVSILRGAPSPDLARLFVEFCMSHEGQALWQYHAKGADAPPGTLGPVENELRRQPIRPDMYDGSGGVFQPHFVDDLDPYAIASDVASMGWRDAIAPLLAAMAIDAHEELIHAWDSINEARRVGGHDLAAMESLFYAMPTIETPDGSLVMSARNAEAILNKWKDGRARSLDMIAMTEFFRENYRQVRRIADDN